MSKFQSNEIKEKKKLYILETFKCQCINESHRSQQKGLERAIPWNNK